MKEKILELVTVQEGGADFEEITHAKVALWKKESSDIGHIMEKVKLFEQAKVGERIYPTGNGEWPFSVGYCVMAEADEQC